MHTLRQLCDRLRAHIAFRPIAYVAVWLAAFLRLTTGAVAQETVTYYHTDAVGSVRVTTDASGQPTFYDYLPFGEPFTPPPTPTQRGFAGKEKDADTNLDYFGARFYASGTGRFTTIDPVMTSARLTNPPTFNRYAYARNNPLRYVDPDGRDVDPECIADPKCTIKLKINVIYDRKHPLTDQQKAEAKATFLDKAQADFKRSNIEIDFNFSAGTLDGNRLTGQRDGYLNAVLTTGGEVSVKHSSGAFVDQGWFWVNVAHGTAAGHSNYLLWANDFQHEMGHFAISEGKRTFFSNVVDDAIINGLLFAQTAGASISSFRAGFGTRAFAVEANPAARLPKIK